MPLLPALQAGKQLFYGPLFGGPGPDAGHRPIDGDGFLVRDGKGAHNFTLTSGMWWLLVGDLPRWKMELRWGTGTYAQPDLLPCPTWA